MKKNGIVGNSIVQSEAVSEIIGVVLMISLVVIGVGIVSVIIVGQDTPIELPSLSMIPATDYTDLFLYHTGGDSLKRGEFLVRVDGVDYYTAFTDDIDIKDQGGATTGDWDSWDLGESLIIKDKANYNQILIISTLGGQGSIIAGSGEAVITSTSTATGTPTSTVTGTPTPTPGPVAGFTSNITSGFIPLSVSFTDSSTGTPTSWSWDFGDSGTSALQNPEHTYTSPGTYDVSLTVSNAEGSDTEIKAGYITVNAYVPVANFSADPTAGYAPLVVTFTDLSTGGPTSWSWDFGDGQNSTDQNPVHTYSSPGTYTVILNASNLYGSDEMEKTGYIVVNTSLTPAAWWKFDESSGSTAYDSSGNNNNGVIYGSVIRESAGACNGALYFDGTSTYVLVPDSNTLDAPAYLTYTAWLRPEPPEPSGFDNYTSLIDKGSNDVDNYELFVSRVGSTSEFTFETYAGYFRDYTTNAFTYDYNKWQHLAFVADTDAGTAKLYIDGVHVATMSGLPSYFETNSDSLTLGRQQYAGYPLYYRGLMDEVQLYTVALDDNQIRTIYELCTPPPIADFTQDQTFGTVPLTVTFTDLSTGGPTSWSWNFGDGGTSTVQNPSYTYNSVGTYDVTLTVSNAAGSSQKTVEDLILVISPPPPDAEFSGTPVDGSRPLTVSFTDLSTGTPTSWLWDFGDGGTSTDQNPNHVYTVRGRYTVSLTVTNAYGSDTETKTRYIRVRN
ncbi:MAG: PKD domain-containing protein [Methanomicrobiaceae archaeon]|nr:PKD domain-containing protein [Methanomicrobiaceae archaeon]